MKQIVLFVIFSVFETLKPKFLHQFEQLLHLSVCLFLYFLG